MTTVALLSGVVLLLAGGLFLLELALAALVIVARASVWIALIAVGLAASLALLPFRPKLVASWWAEGWSATPAR